MPKYKGYTLSEVSPIKEDVSPSMAGALIGANVVSSLGREIANINHNIKHKVKYIGGTPRETRNKLWSSRPQLTKHVNRVASVYGVDPAALRYRLGAEGFVDSLIKDNNIVAKNFTKKRYKPDSKILFNPKETIIGTNGFGTDDVGYLLKEGKIKLLGNERWYDGEFLNEHNRWTNSATGVTNADNIGLTAAALKYYLERATKNNPNFSPYDLNRTALIYYNRGEAGGKRYMKNDNSGYKYK